MAGTERRTRALEALTALHAISARQAIISTQLGELIELTTKPREGALIERLSELFQPLFKDMAEIRETVKKRAGRGGTTQP